jgi:hypothetical protein
VIFTLRSILTRTTMISSLLRLSQKTFFDFDLIWCNAASYRYIFYCVPVLLCTSSIFGWLISSHLLMDAITTVVVVVSISNTPLSISNTPHHFQDQTRTFRRVAISIQFRRQCPSPTPQIQQFGAAHHLQRWLYT